MNATTRDVNLRPQYGDESTHYELRAALGGVRDLDGYSFGADRDRALVWIGNGNPRYSLVEIRVQYSKPGKCPCCGVVHGRWIRVGGAKVIVRRKPAEQC